MKICIGLYGVYSNIYKKNNYEGDIFMLTHDKTIIEDDDRVVQIDELNNNTLDLKNVGLYNKQTHKRRMCIDNLLNNINNYEYVKDSKYDIIVLTSFRDLILNFPKDKGIYRTKYYLETSYIPHVTLPSFEIVSDMYIRYNGSGVINIYSLEQELLQKLLTILFDNKVVLPCNFKNIDADLLFCIPSVINTSANPFNYVNYRSVFTPEERIKQTVKQAQSLYELSKNSSICLLEGSQLNLEQMRSLSEYCTKIILFSKDEEANRHANSNLNKSIFEVYCMKFMFERSTFNHAFKFGGRYTLHPNFDIKMFLTDKPCFKIIDSQNTFTNSGNIIECIIYSIPRSLKDTYIQTYNTIIYEINIDHSNAIEKLLYDHSHDINRLEYLNVYGRDAIEGFDNLV